MPVTRLLAVMLLASAAIALAQVQNQNNFLTGPTLSKDTHKSGQTTREPWQIIPDLSSELFSPLRPQTQAVIRPYLPDGEISANWICYSIRSYVVARDDEDSDSTHPVSSSDCQPANRYRVKKAQEEPVLIVR
jgi:hypothetical protein